MWFLTVSILVVQRFHCVLHFQIHSILPITNISGCQHNSFRSYVILIFNFRITKTKFSLELLKATDILGENYLGFSIIISQRSGIDFVFVNYGFSGSRKTARYATITVLIGDRIGTNCLGYTCSLAFLIYPKLDDCICLRMRSLAILIRSYLHF